MSDESLPCACRIALPQGDTNLETNCTIYFTSDNEGDGDCQLNSITQPGWAGWESMHLRAL